MTKVEKETKIISRIKALPKSYYGDYRLSEDLVRIIADVMGYKLYYFVGGRYSFADNEDEKKVYEIIHRMENRNIIVRSKSKEAFKYLGR